MTTTLQSSPTASLPSETCKAIVFDIAGYAMALPLSAIHKIMLFSPSLVNNVATGEFMYLGDRPVTLLDLYPSLSQLKPVDSSMHDAVSSDLAASAAPKRKFLIVSRLESGNLCAIPVEKPPTLLDIRLASVQPLPTFYPQAARNLANYVAVQTYQGAVLTMFLLNLQQALDRITSSNLSRN